MAQHRIPVEETFAWQRPVLSFLNDQPVGPAKGDRYIVGTPTASDPWETHDGEIAWYSGTEWKFDSPQDGWVAFNRDTNKIYVFNAAAWAVQSAGKAAELDDGAGNVVTAAQAKEAYTRRGSYDSDLGCIIMEI